MSVARNRVLHLVHRMGAAAGTELFVEGIARSEDAFDHIQVACGLSDDVVSVDSNERARIRIGVDVESQSMMEMGSLPDGEDGSLFSVSSVRDAGVASKFRSLVTDLRPSLIHVHNLVGWPHLEFDFSAPHVVTIYDHFWICPDYFFLNWRGERCEKGLARHDDKECLECVSKKARRGLVGTDEIGEFLRFRGDAMARICRTASHVMVPSVFMRDRLDQAGYLDPKRTSVVPFGSRLERGSTAPSEIRRNPLRVAFVGNFDLHKGAEVFCSLVDECSDLPIEFKIVGAVSMQWQDVLKERGIESHGAYRVSELPEILSTVDLALVLSIVDESYCMVVDDLACCGVPVIASRVGAISERVVEGGTGFLVDPGSASQVRTKLEWLLRDESILEGMCQYLQTYSVPTRVRAYSEVLRTYRAVLGS